MKKLILVMIVLVSVVYFINMQNEKQENMLDTTMMQKENTNPINKISNQESKRNKIPDEHLLHIAKMIAPPTNQELKNSWRIEYNCNQTVECLDKFYNARSYEDALWLKRKGYPSLSATDILKDVSKIDLMQLSNQGNTDASALLAIDALKEGQYQKAGNFAFKAAVNNGPFSRETFGYRLKGEALVLNNKPMVANFYLRVAAILGDTGAADTYARITTNTASAVIDSTNQMAYNYLLKKLNTDINNLNNDPRPIGGGG